MVRVWGLAVVGVVIGVAVGVGVLVWERGTVPDAGGASVGVPIREPGPATVVLLEDVGAHPEAEYVRAVLQRHFDSINTGDYELWSSTVTAERVRATPRSVWREQYRSTLDGTIVVHRLEARPGGGLVALLSFTSVQDPAYAPPDLPVPCLRWRVSYPLVGEADRIRLASTSPNASLRQQC